jgi:pimeloyl-ACP methyl ester carboxylesterase
VCWSARTMTSAAMDTCLFLGCARTGNRADRRAPCQRTGLPDPVMDDQPPWTYGETTPRVRGREDRILPPECAEWLHERVPHAELHWMDEAGHLLQEDAPGRLLTCLTAGFAAA